jgi:hypothetical protein
MKSHPNGHSRGTKGTMASPHQPRAGKIATVSAPQNKIGKGTGSKASPVKMYDSTGGGTA